MILSSINDYGVFKNKFRIEFYSFLNTHLLFKKFLYDVLVEGTAYVVGGYLRDIVNGVKSRDVDIILNLPSDRLISILESSKLLYSINRMGGVKVRLNNSDVDLWNFENNWSFKNNLVKYNQQYIVENIAEGCFYNFDSIVININDLELCSKYYNECVGKKELDIIQKNDNYKKLNPTIEANIIRAIFLKNTYGLQYSQNCSDYLIRRIIHLRSQYVDFEDHMISLKRNYYKYEQKLSDQALLDGISDIMGGILHPVLF